MSIKAGEWLTRLYIFSFIALLVCCWPFNRPALTKVRAQPTYKLISGIFVDSESMALKADGKSWATAFKTIQQGINAARSGGKIYIASGVYKNPHIEFSNNHDIELIGGYKAGDLYEKYDSLIKNGEWTILDGDNAPDNLVEISGRASNISFSGLSFENVKGGSGVVIIGALEKPIQNIFINNCQFINNHDSQGGGGGIFVSYARNIQIMGVMAHNNATDDTGGFIHAENVAGLKISSGVFSYNRALLNGGSIYVQNSSDVKISEQFFDHNLASFGGALAIISSKFIRLSNLIFKKNEAMNEGGAVSIIQSADATLQHGIFSKNRSKGYGGALCYCGAQGHITIKSSEFRANVSKHGGGLFFFGADLPSTVTVDQSTFANNFANLGGAMVIIDTTRETVIKDTVFIANESRHSENPLHLTSNHSQARFIIGPGINYK